MQLVHAARFAARPVHFVITILLQDLSTPLLQSQQSFHQHCAHRPAGTACGACTKPWGGSTLPPDPAIASQFESIKEGSQKAKSDSIQLCHQILVKTKKCETQGLTIQDSIQKWVFEIMSCIEQCSYHTKCCSLSAQQLDMNYNSKQQVATPIELRLQSSDTVLHCSWCHCSAAQFSASSSSMTTADTHLPSPGLQPAADVTC